MNTPERSTTFTVRTEIDLAADLVRVRVTAEVVVPGVTQCRPATQEEALPAVATALGVPPATLVPATGEGGRFSHWTFPLDKLPSLDESVRDIRRAHRALHTAELALSAKVALREGVFYPNGYTPNGAHGVETPQRGGATVHGPNTACIVRETPWRPWPAPKIGDP